MFSGELFGGQPNGRDSKSFAVLSPRLGCELGRLELRHKCEWLDGLAFLLTRNWIAEIASQFPSCVDERDDESEGDNSPGFRGALLSIRQKAGSKYKIARKGLRVARQESCICNPSSRSALACWLTSVRQVGGQTSPGT